MSKNIAVAGRAPKMAFSDFDFVRLVVGFVGDLARSLEAVLVFIRDLITFLG